MSDLVDLVNLINLFSQLEGRCVVGRGLQDWGYRRDKLRPVVGLLLNVVGCLPVKSLDRLLHNGHSHDGCLSRGGRWNSCRGSRHVVVAG